jgi:hypothetical protein
MKTLTTLLVLILTTLTFEMVLAKGDAASVPASESVTSVADNPARTAVLAVASAVMAALQAHDGRSLATLAHPLKGVRFSPYASVDTNTEVS